MKPLWFALLASLLGLAAGLFGPLAQGAGTVLEATGVLGAVLVGVMVLAALAGHTWSALALVPLGLGAMFLAVRALTIAGVAGAWGYWALVWGCLLAVLAGVNRVSLREPPPAAPMWEKRARRLLPPAAIPCILLLVWQGLIAGYNVPRGIFPSVQGVWQALGSTLPVLLADSYVTFVKEVLLGLAIGLTSGLVAGVAIAYSRFLQRGFLPLASAFGAVPIVGLAPVLGRAFGVNWESKAAVVVIVTFFPVVLNTVQGLVLVDPLKLELLRAYAAKPWEIFLKLRLPSALPYLFNALKVAVVLSVVSVIVAEFLIPGPPEGLGQRISLSARRGAYDIVFAAITVTSAITVSAYGLVSVLERLVTSWHPSFREETT